MKSLKKNSFSEKDTSKQKEWYRESFPAEFSGLFPPLGFK